MHVYIYIYIYIIFGTLLELNERQGNANEQRDENTHSTTSSQRLAIMTEAYRTAKQ